MTVKLSRKQKGPKPKWRVLGQWARACQAKNLEVWDLICIDENRVGRIVKIQEGKKDNTSLTLTLDYSYSSGTPQVEIQQVKKNSRPLVWLGPEDIKWATFCLNRRKYFYPVLSSIERGIKSAAGKGSEDPVVDFLEYLNNDNLSLVNKAVILSVEKTIEDLRPYLLQTKCGDEMQDFFQVKHVKDLFWALSVLLAQVKDQTSDELS